jgi:hypothetical protein
VSGKPAATTTTPKKTPTPAVEVSAQETYFGNLKFPIQHLGEDFIVNERDFESLDKAKAYRALLIQAEVEAETADLTDIIPEGYGGFQDRTLQFRNNILELPMNETHYPDGSLNPLYDRRFAWVWAADRATDVAEKQARGYQLVSFDQLSEMSKEDTFPDHYLNLIRAEGSYVVYGDLVLMRIPRFIQRQRRNEADQMVMDRFKRQDEEAQAVFDNAGMKQVELPFRNTVEVSYNNPTA